MKAYPFIGTTKSENENLPLPFPLVWDLDGKGLIWDFRFLRFEEFFNFTRIIGGKGTRSLWNDGQQIVWDDFIHLVNDEVNSCLKLIPS